MGCAIATRRISKVTARIRRLLTRRRVIGAGSFGRGLPQGQIIRAPTNRGLNPLAVFLWKPRILYVRVDFLD